MQKNFNKGVEKTTQQKEKNQTSTLAMSAS